MAWGHTFLIIGEGALLTKVSSSVRKKFKVFIVQYQIYVVLVHSHWMEMPCFPSVLHLQFGLTDYSC